MIGPDEALPLNSTITRHARAPEARQNPPVQVFRLRRIRAEQDLSAGWLEFFEDCPTEYERYAAACTQLAGNLNPNKNDQFLVIDVDRAREALASSSALSSVQIVFSPVFNRPGFIDNPSHASVVGMYELAEPLEQLAAEQLALAVRADRMTWRDLQSHGLVLKK